MRVLPDCEPRRMLAAAAEGGASFAPWVLRRVDAHELASAARKLLHTLSPQVSRSRLAAVACIHPLAVDSRCKVRSHNRLASRQTHTGGGALWRAHLGPTCAHSSALCTRAGSGVALTQ